jgi:hypothetical protein
LAEAAPKVTRQVMGLEATVEIPHSMGLLQLVAVVLEPLEIVM